MTSYNSSGLSLQDQIMAMVGVGSSKPLNRSVYLDQEGCIYFNPFDDLDKIKEIILSHITSPMLKEVMESKISTKGIQSLIDSIGNSPMDIGFISSSPNHPKAFIQMSNWQPCARDPECSNEKEYIINSLKMFQRKSHTFDLHYMAEDSWFKHIQRWCAKSKIEDIKTLMVYL